MLVAMMNHIFAVYPSDQIGLLTLWLSDANAQLITLYPIWDFTSIKFILLLPQVEGLPLDNGDMRSAMKITGNCVLL